MATAHALELARLELQDKLDAAKEPAERNKLGQFATPTELATEMLEYAKSLLPRHAKVRFLDPAFGTGSFYSALLRVSARSWIVRATGYEIDPHYGRRATELWRDTPLEVHVSDFTRATPPAIDAEKPTLLICNPPYVRHHHLAADEKLRLQHTTEEATGIRLSGLSGLYCYFLCLSQRWMAPNGIAGWLIPSEFMDVNYGEHVKRFLLTRVTLLHIHRFDPNDVQFDDALVSSAVVWLRNSPPPAEHGVEFSYGGTLAEPRLSKQISSDELLRATKWTRFLNSFNGESEATASTSAVTSSAEACPGAPGLNDAGAHTERRVRLADLFRIQRGLATGSNEFFVLTPEQIAEYNLPHGFLTPILPSPRFLTIDEIDADENGEPLIDRKHFLLACELPEHEVEARYPSLWKYLQLGIKRGIHERYLCRHRTPWYFQETRPPAPLLCTYMGRLDAGRGKPFRFILNHSRATAANVYLLLYPKPALAKQLRSEPAMLRAVWQALNGIAPEDLMGEGRVYGGGLHKLEPNELGNASGHELLAVVPHMNTSQAAQRFLFTETVPKQGPW
jgi:predicted RNA methylase